MIIITKKKLKAILESYRKANSQDKFPCNYDTPDSKQQILNGYYTGYSHGCSNIINALEGRFGL